MRWRRSLLVVLRFGLRGVPRPRASAPVSPLGRRTNGLPNELGQVPMPVGAVLRDGGANGAGQRKAVTLEVALE
jgi:hypothetical protein